MSFLVSFQLLEKSFLWWGLSNALIYENKDKNQGYNFILCPLSRIIVIDSPLGPKTQPVISFRSNKTYKEWVLSCKVAFEPSYKVISNICATVTPLGISFQASYQWSLWDDWTLFLEVFIQYLALWMVAIVDETCIPLLFHVLWLKYVLSWATKSYHQVLEGNQEGW